MRFRGAALAVALTAGGCVSANGFRDAEPVPPSRVEIFAGAGGFVTTVESVPTPLSSVGFRTGLSSGVDVGALLGPLQLRVDATFRLLRSGVFTLSVSPAVSVGGLDLEASSDDLSPFFGADATLLASLALHPRARLTLFAGPGLGFVPAREDDGFESELAFLIRSGGGLRVWLLDAFALHPEAVVTTHTAPGLGLVDAALSLGFVFAPGRRP